MRTIYVDNEYKCHITNDGTMRAVETYVFNGKSDVFIERYCFIPTGESQTQGRQCCFL